MATIPTANVAQSTSQASAFRCSPTLAGEQDALGNFLAATFPDSARVDSFRPDVLAWKYFSPHPEWRDPRSYVLKAGGRFVAHAGIWPVHLVGSSVEISARHLIDWAADAAEPGTGICLLRKLADDGKPLLTIGGSSASRSILPRLGYRSVGEMKVYAKVVRPWLQFCSTPGRNWKAPLRMIRNAAWSLSGMRSPGTNWRASRIARFDSSLEPLLNCAPSEKLVSRRTIMGLNHFLTCPAAAFSAFVVLQSERICGYFLLGQVGKQTRIVELQVGSEDPEYWLQACKVASRTAADLPETSEIIAGFSCSRPQRALELAGFRLRREDPIYVYDAQKVLGTDPKLEVSLLDGDACFIRDSRYPFLT